MGEEFGNGSYDPAKYEAGFIKEAFNALGIEGQGGAGGGGQLTEEVKEFQRSSLPNSKVWRRYCDDYGDGTYDPSAYNGSFLRAFLASAAGQTSKGGGKSSKGGGKIGKGGGKGQGSLTERVKELQRSGENFAEAWREYCDEYGGGLYDPSKHDAAFVRAALKTLAND